jgi:prolyl 4-hydroxylase
LGKNSGMSPQAITPELRQWIVDQARAGCRPEDVLASMRASGWAEDVAINALEQTLKNYLADTQRAAVQRPADGLPPAVPVPEPVLLPGQTLVRAHDRQVRLLLTLRNPRVIVFGGLLSDEECDAMVELARPRLARSETVQLGSGGSEVNAARTSDGMFFDRGEFPLCRTIEQRIAALVNWPVENGEGLQVLRYRPGAEYKAHHDYFDPAQPGTPTILKRGGQRVGTVVMYLNQPGRGGGTAFPDVDLEVAPCKGNAVFFSYDRAHPVTRTLHAGTAVLEGEKWVATKWLRESEFR